MNREKAIHVMNKVHGCIANINDVRNGAEHVKVESLMSIEGYIWPERAKEIFEDVVELVKHLPTPFLDNGSGQAGWTFLNIPTLANEHGDIGEQWGEQSHAGALVLICSYYGIVQDPLHTLNFKADNLKDLPGGVSYFSFNVQPQFLDMVRRSMNISSGLVIA